MNKNKNIFPSVYDRWEETIDRFTGDYSFLSNTYPIQIKVEDDKRVYPSVENAYQAAKVAEDNKDYYTTCSPKKAKEMGKGIETNEDWEFEKVAKMRELVQSKFEQYPELMEKLSSTGRKKLKMGNLWHDNFWGDCECPKCKDIEGRNLLGVILMSIRYNNNEND